MRLRDFFKLHPMFPVVVLFSLAVSVTSYYLQQRTIALIELALGILLAVIVYLAEKKSFSDLKKTVSILNANVMRLIERFLKYVQFDTQSDDNSNACPSTQGQMVFARYLKDELEAIGMQDIVLDDNGYLYATLPSNTEKYVPVIGFIAHMDT